jgi:hypothetical protein
MTRNALLFATQVTVLATLLGAQGAAAATAVSPPPAGAMPGMSMESHGRYLGPPDLALTSAIVAAGGGPEAFSSAQLSSVLAGSSTPAELASLRKRFGAARVARYFATFDWFVDGAVAIATQKNIALPSPDPALTGDPARFAAAVRAAGVMPDGRWDVGYFIEHLLSRPLHKTLMDEANADPHIGPAANADFHVILTAEMSDLKALYHLPQ